MLGSATRAAAVESMQPLLLVQKVAADTASTQNLRCWRCLAEICGDRCQGAGYVFGFVQALGPTVVSECFGLSHFATNSAFVSTMFIASSFGIAKSLSNWSYRAGIKDGEGECHGQICFARAFWACTVISLIATLCSVVLTIKRRAYYRRMFRCALLHLVRRIKREAAQCVCNMKVGFQFEHPCMMGSLYILHT